MCTHGLVSCPVSSKLWINSSPPTMDCLLPKIYFAFKIITSKTNRVINLRSLLLEPPSSAQVSLKISLLCTTTARSGSTRMRSGTRGESGAKTNATPKSSKVLGGILLSWIPTTEWRSMSYGTSCCHTRAVFCRRSSSWSNLPPRRSRTRILPSDRRPIDLTCKISNSITL